MDSLFEFVDPVSAPLRQCPQGGPLLLDFLPLPDQARRLAAELLLAEVEFGHVGFGAERVPLRLGQAAEALLQLPLVVFNRPLAFALAILELLPAQVQAPQMLFALGQADLHLGDFACANLPIRLEPLDLFAEAADARFGGGDLVFDDRLSAAGGGEGLLGLIAAADDRLQFGLGLGSLPLELALAFLDGGDLVALLDDRQVGRVFVFGDSGELPALRIDLRLESGGLGLGLSDLGVEFGHLRVQRGVRSAG